MNFYRILVLLLFSTVMDNGLKAQEVVISAGEELQQTAPFLFNDVVGTHGDRCYVFNWGWEKFQIEAFNIKTLKREILTDVKVPFKHPPVSVSYYSEKDQTAYLLFYRGTMTFLEVCYNKKNGTMDLTGQLYDSNCQAVGVPSVLCTASIPDDGEYPKFTIFQSADSTGFNVIKRESDNSHQWLYYDIKMNKLNEKKIPLDVSIKWLSEINNIFVDNKGDVLLLSRELLPELQWTDKKTRKFTYSVFKFNTQKGESSQAVLKFDREINYNNFTVTLSKGKLHLFAFGFDKVSKKSNMIHEIFDTEKMSASIVTDTDLGVLGKIGELPRSKPQIIDLHFQPDGSFFLLGKEYLESMEQRHDYKLFCIYISESGKHLWKKEIVVSRNNLHMFQIDNYYSSLCYGNLVVMYNEQSPEGLGGANYVHMKVLKIDVSGNVLEKNTSVYRDKNEPIMYPGSFYSLDCNTWVGVAGTTRERYGIRKIVMK